MKLGSLIFVSGTGLVSWLIKRITRSKWSHVAIFIGDGNVMEAQAFRDVGMQHLSAYEGEYDAIPLPERVSDYGLKNGLDWLYEQQGRHYSYWSDIVILFRCLFGIVLPWKEGAGIMCVRLARDFVFACGIPVPDKNMDPEEFYEWLQKYDLQKSPLVDTMGAG